MAMLALVPTRAVAQPMADPGDASSASSLSQTPPAPAPAYVPITGLERIHWTVDGTIAPGVLGFSVFIAAVQTGINTPEEWSRTARGFAKRYLEREADVAISNAIEAGVGALWREDPRYLPSHRHGVWPRVGYAMKTTFLAPRRDGRLAPAWGRYAGNVFNNIIENTYLPPSVTTRDATIVRSAGGLLTRMISNLYFEFWPDVVRHFTK